MKLIMKTILNKNLVKKETKKMIKYDSSDSERESESEKDSDVEMNEPPKNLKY